MGRLWNPQPSEALCEQPAPLHTGSPWWPLGDPPHQSFTNVYPELTVHEEAHCHVVGRATWHGTGGDIQELRMTPH